MKKLKTFDQLIKDGQYLVIQTKGFLDKEDVEIKYLDQALYDITAYVKFCEKEWLAKYPLDQNQTKALRSLLNELHGYYELVDARIRNTRLLERISNLAVPEPKQGVTTRDLKKSHIYPHKYPKSLIQRILAQN